MKNKKVIALLMAMSISIVAVGCGAKESKDDSKNNGTNVTSTENNSEKQEVGQLILSGSSTLAPVVNEIITNFTETHKTWSSVDSTYGDEKIDIVVAEGGSGAAIKGLLDDTSNFGLVSRPVKEEEKASLEGYSEYNLGTDALTISINPENELLKYKEGLSTEELSKIFSGEFKYWDDVDKNLPHEEIVVITRDISGGAHQVFQEKVMGDTEVSPNVIQASSMGALVTKIIENKNAIGYASFGVVNQNEGKVSPIKIDGIEPTAENILSGSYKISRPLLIISKGDLSPAEQAFIDACTSEEGMKVVKDLGFVPAK